MQESTSTTRSYGRIPSDLQAEYDRVMATAPIAYRGFLIKPLSHAFQPFTVTGKAIYWGYNVIYAEGRYKGCNAAPGATWSESIGGAKTIIDCIHEAGPEEPYRDTLGMSREDARVYLANRAAWSQRFWALMHERRGE